VLFGDQLEKRSGREKEITKSRVVSVGSGIELGRAHGQAKAGNDNAVVGDGKTAVD